MDVAKLRGLEGWLRCARLKLVTPARTYDELILAAFTDDGQLVHAETAARLMSVPAIKIGDVLRAAPEARLDSLLGRERTDIVGRAQARLGEFLNEEEERLDNWRDDARISFDQQIKTLTKEANEKKKLARAVSNLKEKVELQREASALKRRADDLQHQLYTRLKDIDDERERMLDEIADKLGLTPEMTPLFTIRWSLA